MTSTSSCIKTLLTSLENFDFEFEAWKNPPTNPMTTGRDMGSSHFAQMARDENNDRKANTYRLLTLLTNLIFEPAKEKGRIPFRCPFTAEETNLLKDVSLEVAEQLVDVAKTVALAPLRARLFDFCHILVRKKRRECAREAVEAYLEGLQSLKEPHWEIKALQRTYCLVQTYNLDREQEVNGLILTRLQGGATPFEELAHRYGLLAGLFELGYSPLDNLLALVKVETVYSDNAPSHLRQLLLDLERKIQQKPSSGATKRDAEETLRRMADLRVEDAGHQTSPFRAVHRLKLAHETYKQLGDKRMQALCIHALSQQQKRVVAEEVELHEGECEVGDIFGPITEFVVEPSRDWFNAHVRLATYIFATLPDPTELEAQAEELAGKFVFTHFADHTVHNREGETVAHSEGGSLEPHIRILMASRFGLLANQLAWAQYTLLGKLGPLNLSDIRSVVNSVFADSFPHGESLARGIYRGWGGDWPVSMGLLLPVLENTIRLDLTIAGALPFKIKREEIQEKYLLHHLLRDHSDRFAPSYHFALERTLVSKNGLNLRNLYCHGLIADDEYSWQACMMAWALVIVTVFYPRHNQLISSKEQNRPGGTI